MKYLVTMTPLEPYAFGTDRNFKFEGVDQEKEKGTYFILSNEMPEQTTILGMLRYLMISGEKELLWPNYNPEESKEKLKEYIGLKSFSFQSKEVQDFGYIKEVSPVFLKDEKGDYYIKNPFHNKAEKGYTPMRLSEDRIKTSAGEIFLPLEGEYNAKNGYGSGYYNLSDGTITHDMFRSVIVTGNRKNDGKGNDKEGFFKRELKILKEKVSFAVYVEAEEGKLPLDKDKIVYMGQKKSAFKVKIEKVEDVAGIQKKVEEHFKGKEGKWYYALSDLIPEEDIRYETFCIVEEKQHRNLETIAGEKGYKERLKKSEVRYNMLQSGSVFFNEIPSALRNTASESYKNCKKIGYNHIVQLGGE